MNSKSNFAFFALAVSLAVPSLFGQPGESVTIASTKGDFSVDIPGTDWIVDIDRETRTIYRVGSAHSVTINMRASGSAKNEMREQMRFYKEKDGYKHFEGGDFLVRHYTGNPKDETDEGEKKAYIWLSFASSKGYYSVSLSAPSVSDQFYREVLGSIRLNNKPFLKTASQTSSAKKVIAIESLSTDERVLRAIRMPDSQQATVDAGTEEEYSKKDSTVYSRPLIVLRKIKAAYTDGARRKRVSGTVNLLVTFQANGALGPIKLVRSLDKGLDKAAFEAARTIKFLPAEVDGKPVDSVRPVVYSFSVY
jgi:TonB family protein